MLFLLYHAPTLSGYHSHLHDDPQLHRADATLPHKKLTVRDPVIQICKTSPSVTVLIVLFLQASRLDVRLFAMCNALQVSPGRLDENVANISWKNILANGTQKWRMEGKVIKSFVFTCSL